MPINEKNVEDKKNVKQFFEWIRAGRYSDLNNWFEKLGKESSKILVNEKRYGQTALDIACELSNKKQVSWLLKNNADVDLKSNGIYPINRTINAGKFELDIFDMLVKEIKNKFGKFKVQRDIDNKAPLDHAIYITDKEERLKCVGSLLMEGASVDSKHPSPLLEAIKIGGAHNDTLFPLLYHYNSKYSILDSLPGIGNALFVAAQYGNIYAAEIIIAKARDMKAGTLISLINNVDGECNDLAKVARECGHPKFVEWLTEANIAFLCPEGFDSTEEKNDDALDEDGTAAACDAYAKWDPDLDSIIPRDTTVAGQGSKVDSDSE